MTRRISCRVASFLRSRREAGACPGGACPVSLGGGAACYGHPALTKSLRCVQVCESTSLHASKYYSARNVVGTGGIPWGAGACGTACGGYLGRPAASTMFAVPAVDHVSPVSPAQAAEITRPHYGVGGTAERLASEYDDTFRLAGADGVARLLKISVAPDPVAVASGLPLPASPGVARGRPGFQTALLLHLARVAPGLPAQRVVATLDGRPELTLARGRRGIPVGPPDLVAGRATARPGDDSASACAGRSARRSPV